MAAGFNRGVNKKNDFVHYNHAGSGMLQIGYNMRKALVMSSAPWYIYPVISPVVIFILEMAQG
jgi:hypothetical protein